MQDPPEPAAPAAEVDHVFLLPDLGEGLVSAQIVEWLVAEGSVIAVDDPVATVETEKTAVELPSPYAGRVTRLHGAAQDRIAVGSPLVTVTGAAAESPDGGAPPAGAHLIGQHRDAVPPAARRELLAAIRLPDKPGRDRVAAAPAVRRLARELGVDLHAVTGTGRGGAISREDVLGAGAGAEGGPGR